MAKNETKDKLNELAELCSETTGASFTISRLKDRKWTVSFPNSGSLRQVKHLDLDVALVTAIADLKHCRTPLETEVKYTVYS